MKRNMVVLFKTSDGQIYCKQITPEGLEAIGGNFDKESEFEDIYWEAGGTITLDELDEILSKDRSTDCENVDV